MTRHDTGKATANTLRPRQDGRHFADDIFTCIFVNENCCILITFSLKYIRKGPMDNNPALVQIMAWRRSGEKPLSEPMMVSLLTHICVTRPQWVNLFHILPSSKPMGDFRQTSQHDVLLPLAWFLVGVWKVYMRQFPVSSLYQEDAFQCQML